ncbi:MAG: Dna2/Cas4 domain-containing protein, partial [Sulfolobales archaeon]
MITHRVIDRLSPTLVKQYIYCPVIVWLNIWLGVFETPSDSMIIGGESRDTSREVRVSNEKGSAVADEIRVERDHKILIERKSFKSKSVMRYIAQAITTYTISREKHEKIREFILEISGDSRRILITEDMLETYSVFIERVREIMRNERIPRPDNQKKCEKCWYKRYCLYT